MPGEVASLTRDHVIDWVNRYGKAWQEQSVKGILELFTDAGTKLELVLVVIDLISKSDFGMWWEETCCFCYICGCDMR